MSFLIEADLQLGQTANREDLLTKGTGEPQFGQANSNTEYFLQEI